MSPVFDPRAFDARAFQAPPGDQADAGQPGRVTVSVTLTATIRVTVDSNRVTCTELAPTVEVSCGPAVPG